MAIFARLAPFAAAAVVAGLVTVGGVAATGATASHGVGPSGHPASGPVAHPASAHPNWGAASARHFSAATRSVRTATPTVRPATAHSPKIASTVIPAVGGSSASIEVVVHGASGTVADAVRGVGGSVVAATVDAVTATVPTAKLDALAGSDSVTAITPPVKGFTESTSQGVTLAGAATWQAAGDDGTGVKVGIVDGGFASLSTEVAAGNLPAGLTVIGNNCANVNNTNHGTAVAEIVHQMAPGASLFLYCVDDETGFAQAAQQLQSSGVTIVNSSLGFPAAGRGDGTGQIGQAVEQARQNGVLWIQSAGNNALDHWSGSMVDANADSVIDLNGPNEESDGVFVYGTDDTGGAPGSADLVAQWDQWPTNQSTIRLFAFGYQCVDDACTNETPINPESTDPSTPTPIALQSGSTPYIDIPIVNSTHFEQEWDVLLVFVSGASGEHYDLSYWGDVAPYSFLAQAHPAQAAAGSITEPATSPYALAVGAVDGSGTNACGGDATNGTTPRELFSSQGPTIDGRVKPDIAAYDATAGNLYTEFCGTSAAAPHVAGAAALVAAANPSMDAAQLEYFLEQRANNGSPANPPNDQTGHGVLTLGAHAGVTPPAGVGYAALNPPVRVLDTRPAYGGSGSISANNSISVSVTAAGVPSTATAVAINLTGVDAAGPGYLSAYPGGTTWPGTSNLNLDGATDSTAPVFAIVTLGPNETINVLAGATRTDALVDVLGYFDPTTSGTKYTPAASSTRIVDTRDGTGGHTGAPGSHVDTYTLAGLPSGTTAILVNVTSADAAGPGALCVTPDGSNTSSTVNYVTGVPRANLAVVSLQGGSFSITSVGAASDVIVDLIGTFSPSGQSGYVSLPAPVRIDDTRTGNGGLLGAVQPNTHQRVYAEGFDGVPFDATAVLTNVVAIQPTGEGYLTVSPYGQPLPNTSSINVSPNRIVANATPSGLGNQSLSIYDSPTAGTVNVVADLFGYFVPA
ncbi:MAG: S8 family serine peptidase [Actinobacteria bacterium]|nr:S8 family serine peptidase [Actinomycetota bacterium]